MHSEDDYFAPPPRSPVPAAIVASVITTIAVFFGLRVLEAKGWLPEPLSRLGHGPKIEGAAAPLAAAEVPSLVGLTPEQARLTLQARGFSLSVDGERDNSQLPSGAIVEQAPLAQAQAIKGTVVRVAISAASAAPRKVALAKLSGLKVEEAIRQLAAQKLSAGPHKLLPQDLLPPGVVIDTEPAAGTMVPAQSAVTLLVSAAAVPSASGASPATPAASPSPAATPGTASAPGSAAQRSAPVSPPPGVGARALPRVTGLRLRAARELLEAQGFKVGKLRHVSDGDRASGVVLVQSPPAATRSTAGTSVDLTLND